MTCLGIVWTCLPVATLFPLFGLHTLTGADYRTLALRRIKTSSRVTGPCPMQSLCGQRWKIIPHTKKKPQRFSFFFFAFVPPVDRNLRSRQECARAWSWLSSKQISMRRQVCSACPHSCSCLQLFSFPSGDRIRRVTCSKTGMLAHERTV